MMIFFTLYITFFVIFIIKCKQVINITCNDKHLSLSLRCDAVFSVFTELLQFKSRATNFVANFIHCRLHSLSNYCSSRTRGEKSSNVKLTTVCTNHWEKSNNLFNAIKEFFYINH